MQRIWRLVVSSAVVGLVLTGCNKPATTSAGRWGYIDKTGNFIIQPQFDEASNFNAEGAAFVRDGKRILRLKAKPPGESSDPVKPDDSPALAPGVTLRAAQGADDTYKVMDGDKCVFDVSKKAATNDASKKAATNDVSKKAASNDVSKKAATDDVSKKAATDDVFKGNDYVCVFFGKKCAFLDKQGKIWLSPFEAARNFSEKRAAVEDGHKWGFISQKKGTFVIPPKYIGAGDFVGGLAPVEIPGEAPSK